jgi:flagellin
MRINTNVASMTALEANKNTNNNLTKSLEKLSTGLRINKAADDASGLAIADKLRTQASSISQGISNANSAVALVQIADKAMAEQSNILDTVKQKLIQASTSTTSSDGREAIRKDIVKLLEQFDMIAAQTNYNGTTLLQRSDIDTAKPDNFSFQLGEDKTFDVTAQISQASNTSNLGGGSDTVVSATIGSAVLGPDGTSTTTNNNVDVNGSQQIKTSGSITLASVDIAASGTEITSTSIALSITVSGEIGSLQAVTTAVHFDASNQTEAIKDALRGIATSNTNFQSLGNDMYSLTAANSVSFGDIDFSSVHLGSTATTGEISLNAGATESTVLNITNNNTGTDLPLLGQINIFENAGAGMIGGQLLSDLKDLAEDGLSIDIANSFMATIDEALTQLNTTRADFGSSQNQLESSIRNMQTTYTNLKAAESVIRDVDYAAESANFNKQNIIAQAGTYAISQANNVQQNVMKLLQ